MMVGQGFALDASQEETRLSCQMASVPTYSVSAAFANGPLMRQPIPNPADQYPTLWGNQLQALVPDQLQNAATLYANLSPTIESTDKMRAGLSQLGFNFATNLEYNYQGEDDWTPFVLQLQQAGAQLIYFSGSCLPNYQAFRQAAQVNGYEATYMTEANFYETGCVGSNSDGALDNTYVRMVFVPFEEAADNPATQDYLDLLAASGGDTSLLGATAASSFLLWATAAQACGSELTRQCVLDQIGQMHEWTGHGLHSTTDPGNNNAGTCSMIMLLDGDHYTRVTPEEPATFECAEGSNLTVETTASDAALLDANRVARQFDPSGTL
jgi:ABC-type branched-subunit amino acid transport system substrate-binding protein